MHEAAAAQNIVDTVIAETKKKAIKVSRVVISCGQLNALNDEAMLFAFEAAAAGTICQGAKLEIKHIPLRAVCRDCGSEFDFDLYSPQCPKCGKSDFSISPDAPLMLEEIVIGEDAPQAWHKYKNKFKR